MSSKYTSLLQAKQEPSPISEEPKTAEEAKVEQEIVEAVAKPADTVEPKIEETPAAPTPPVTTAVPSTGKLLNMEPPRGKKGHPEYNQVTIYLKKQTQNKAKIAMLQAQDERDFSELVEDLLTQWLEGKSV